MCDSPKKKKRLCVYLKKWEDQYSWIAPVDNNCSKARCVTCNRVFSIGHGGESDLKQHINTAIHKSFVKQTNTSSKITKFILKKGNDDIL